MIDIYCNDQSVEIDDTLVSFIDLFWFWPISSIYIGRYICSSKNENWIHANSKFIDNWVAIKSQRTKHLLLVTVCRHFLTGFQDLDFPPFQNNVGVVRGVDRIWTAFRISRVNFRENMWTFRGDKGIYLSLIYGCSWSGVPLHNGFMMLTKGEKMPTRNCHFCKQLIFQEILLWPLHAVISESITINSHRTMKQLACLQNTIFRSTYKLYFCCNFSGFYLAL